MSRGRRGNQGFALLHAIFLLLLLTTTIALLVSVRMARIQALRNRQLGTQALYLAEAGASVAASSLSRDGVASGPYQGELGPGSYRAFIDRLAGGRARIRSSGLVQGVVREVTVSGRLEAGRFIVSRWE